MRGRQHYFTRTVALLMYPVTKMANMNHIRILPIFFLTHPIQTLRFSVFDNMIESHPEAIRTYREVERRDKAELAVIHNVKRKMLHRMLGGA